MSPSRTDLQAACTELSARDDVLADAYAQIGVPEWRESPARYATLARAVTFQLISTVAADAIWARMTAEFGDMPTPEAILQANETELRACGQSGPKIAHLKSIAAAVQSGALDFDRLHQLDSPSASRELLAVRGIGPWTANLFLLSALGRIDAFPAGDVGIMEAYRQIGGLEKRHSSKAFSELAQNWRPYRGVAAHLLWGWLNAKRAAAKA